MRKSSWLTVGLVVLTLAGCGKKEPFLVGLVGDLPSVDRLSDSGFRNGALLAAEEINEKGGVNGRPLELAIEDDDGDPGRVARLDELLIGKKVVAIVGHNTSATTGAALPVADRHKVLLMGPEATSSQFAGRPDYFVRNEVRESVFAEALAGYAVQTLHLKSVGALLDEKNALFTRPFFEAFRRKMNALGGSAEVLYAYTQVDAAATAGQVDGFLSRGGQAILLITNGEDTRNLAQVVRRVRDNVPVLGTPWAMPPSEAHNLGVLPEGLVFPCTWAPDSRTPAYLAFQKNYLSRFGLPVDYHAVHAYEAMTIVAHALAKTKGKAATLPQAIAAIGRFDGLQGVIRIDAFGDCQREVSLLKVVGGVPRQVASTPGR